MTPGAGSAGKTAIEALHALMKADLAGQTPLRHQPARPVHWAVARLASCVATAAPPPVRHRSALQVDARAVERFRAEAVRLAGCDGEAGGSREALIGHMLANVRRLARGNYSEPVGRALFSAVAEAVLLLAWMTFDAAPASALAQRYFSHARQLAHRAGNRLLEAAVFTAMSYQARYVGIAGEAAELAAAARRRTLDGDPACLRFYDVHEPPPRRLVLTAVCGLPVPAG